MARRRGNNEGSIYQRKDGLWCGQVSIGGRRLTKYGKTQKEVREWIKETLAKIDGGLTYEGTKITLERFVELWLGGKELARRPKTVLQYRQITTQHILPILGKMRLQEIRPVHIKQLYMLKKNEGRGDRTVQMIHTTLHNVLKHAVREGILGRNPVEAVERPKVEQAEMLTLNEEQARQFLITATGSMFEAVYYLALTTGMREGELLGLKWSDLDWNKGVLFVQRQLQQIEGQGYVLVPPKTKAGRRHIKVGLGTLKQLEAHRERQALERAAAGERWQENDLIFPTTIGTLLDYKRVTSEFKRILKRAGLPDLRFHDLRHTSISSLLEMGMSINTVQRRAGHTKASTTVDIYGHSSVRSQEDAAEKIEEWITPIAVELK
jgi:integrase